MDERSDDSSLTSRRARTAEYFGRLAQSYGSGEYYARRREAVMAALAETARAARAILDLGSGNGRYLAEFHRMNRGALIVGADLSAAMIAETRRQHPEAQPLLRADANEPPFRAESFDLVFLSHVLQFIPESGPALGRIARVVRPRGTVVATVGGTSMREHLRGTLAAAQWEQFQRAALSGRRGRDVRESRRGVFSAAFEAAGLVPEARAAPFRVTWAGFVEWLRIRWLPVAPKDSRAEALKLLGDLERRPRAQSFDLSEGLLFGRKS